MTHNDQSLTKYSGDQDKPIGFRHHLERQRKERNNARERTRVHKMNSGISKLKESCSFIAGTGEKVN